MKQVHTRLTQEMDDLFISKESVRIDKIDNRWEDDWRTSTDRKPYASVSGIMDESNLHAPGTEGGALEMAVRAGKTEASIKTSVDQQELSNSEGKGCGSVSSGSLYLFLHLEPKTIETLGYMKRISWRYP